MTTEQQQNLDRRAASIVGDLMDVPTVDRPAAIAAACAGDSALAANVQQLVSGIKHADGFLSDLTVDANADHFASALTSAPVGEKPGDFIGRYKLLEKIGEGGFGVVFTAEQQKPVRRLIALKVIKLGMDTREVVARFEAERQALAMMDHPNIAKVLDAGATDTGRPYFVMELVRGLPITDYADKHKMSTRQRVELAAQVCRAVQHAHSKGIIHRDLKPTNVLVTTSDDKPVPKVIDFGIAKATQSRLTDRTMYTAHRQLIGTPQYMSPEQADSEGADLDTRSDVYSLGVLTYELLVGTTPFDGKILRSAAFEAMRKMIRDTHVPRPATRLNTLAADARSTVAASRSTDLKKLDQQLRGELDWIVMKALEKDRVRRYDTAAALGDDLNRYLAGEAVLAGPVSGMYRLRKTLHRYRAAVAVGAAIAAVLLLGIAGTTVGLVSATHQRNRAEQKQLEADQQTTAAITSEQKAIASEQEAQRQKTLAEGEKKDALEQKAEAKATLDFFTNDILAKASPNNTKDDKVSKVLVDALITPALKTIGNRFKDQPLVRAAVQDTLCRTLNDLGQYAPAERQGKAAWDARRRVQGDDHPDTLKALNNYANAILGQGRHAEAERLYKQCWDTCRRVQGDDHPDTLMALNNYAIAIDAQGRHAEAERLDKQLWDAQRRVQGDDHPDTLMALNNYAIAIDGQGRYAEAERLEKHHWDAQRRVQGDDHPDTLSALNNYAQAINAQGRHAEAEPLLKQCWDSCRRVLGDSHPLTIQAAKNYAAVRNSLGLKTDRTPATRPGETVEEQASALEAAAKAATGLDGNQAAGMYRKAISLLRSQTPVDEKRIAADEALEATPLLDIGQKFNALRCLRDALAIDKRLLGAKDPVTVAVAGQLATVLDEKHPEEAAAVRAEFGLSPTTAPVTQSVK